jgi:hypothetical protein
MCQYGAEGSPVKLLQTIAPNTGFRDPDHNTRRLALLDDLIAVAVRHKADLVMLPGGYLTVRTEAEVPGAIAEVARRAAAVRIAVIGGVDVPPRSRNPKRPGKGGRSAHLPYFAFAVGPVEPRVLDTRWRQTSSNRENAWGGADEDVPGGGRVVAVAGRRVGVLVCGELFSARARESFAGLGLNLALDLGHSGMGTGVTRAMENIARNGGCAVAHAHHVAGWGGQCLHFVRADGVRRSVPQADCEWVGDDDFWVAWCPRTV